MNGQRPSSRRSRNQTRRLAFGACAVAILVGVACAPDPLPLLPDPVEVGQGAAAVINGVVPLAVDPVADDCALLSIDEAAQLPGIAGVSSRVGADVDTGVMGRSALCEFLLGSDLDSERSLQVSVTDSPPDDVIAALDAEWSSDGWRVSATPRPLVVPGWSVCLAAEGASDKPVRCAYVMDIGATLVVESVDISPPVDLAVTEPLSDAFLDALLRRVGQNLSAP